MSEDTRPGLSSRYLEHLPAVLWEDSAPRQPDFLGRFLLAFEQILTGVGEAPQPGIGEVLDRVHEYFDPQRTPSEFLEWLSGWVALSLRADLDEERRRDFIARAVPLYRLRGTRGGLEELISIYTRLYPTIDEMTTSFQIGDTSRIGIDTALGGGAPHFFRVLLRLPAADPAQMRHHREVVTAIIDSEKPAHTHYALEIESPALQIGTHSTIGVDTLLRA